MATESPQQQQPLEQQPLQQQEPIPEQEPLKGDESDAELAKRLTVIVDSALERVQPMLDLMKQVGSSLALPPAY
jgi:hypothetical protein